MSVSIIQGDVLKTSAKYICHQVNTFGVMGAGVAKAFYDRYISKIALQIKKNYPHVYLEYNKFCSYHTPEELYGKVLRIEENKDRVFLNMFSQVDIGGPNVNTYYEYFHECLLKIREMIPIGEEIAMPYMIGCGLAGGDWSIISADISDTLGLSHIVRLYDFNGVTYVKRKK